MYLEGVIVCVNYSDFLTHTLPHNKNLFNNLVVVTDTKDIKTKQICDFNHVKCVQTDIFYDNENEFNKGAAINYGLQQLSNKDWVVHLDADIYLPPLTRTILENLPLQKNKIYGVDRLMCSSYDEWADFMNHPRKIQHDWVYIHLDAFPIGVRIAEFMNKDGGYEPIGYFQMWNPSGSKVYGYPTQHDFCDRTDVLQCKRFPREHRELLPEVVAVHLDSEQLPEMGKNWRGRKTKLFGPENKTYDQLDSDLFEITERLNKLLHKHNLSKIDLKIKNKSISFHKRILKILFSKTRKLRKKLKFCNKESLITYN